MLTMNNRSVTVNRLLLIGKLKANLKQHEIDYKESVLGYKEALIADLTRALETAQGLLPEDLKTLKPVSFSFPVSYRAEYINAIEMLEWSASNTIELDQATFKAFIQNEWTWSNTFNSTSAMYKSWVGTVLKN